MDESGRSARPSTLRARCRAILRAFELSMSSGDKAEDCLIGGGSSTAEDTHVNLRTRMDQPVYIHRCTGEVLARLLEETIRQEKSLQQQTSLCKRLRSFFVRDNRVDPPPAIVDPPPAAENPWASVWTDSERPRLIFVSSCACTFQNTGDRRFRDERLVISNSWAKSRAQRASEKRLPSIPEETLEETLEEMSKELSRDVEDQPPTSLWKRLQRFCKRTRSPAVVGRHQNEDVPTTCCFPYFHCWR
ncbi:hypothetical protein DPEC_G00285690 [Dallia pectoralis]|uniref:Uncharacterized protein n=1 Tax=Dallia pectoralis TaxID=75939 RepID=A0ACC2FK49_DALPE|nr:hypothetical protein DPEC_G00285690 [Dallia pectoralis]